jgi:PAS domain S-box-containing protein
MVLSSVIGTALLALAGGSGRSPLATWMIWWVGDAMGVVLIVPIGLAVVRGGWRLIERRVETLVFLVAVGALTFVVWYVAVPVRHLVIPLAILGSLRLGPRGAVAITFVAAGVAIGTAAWTPLADNYLLLQSLNASVALTSLTLAAVMYERNDKAAALEAVASYLESRVTERTAELQEANQGLAQAQLMARVGSFKWSASDDHVHWTEELYRIHGLDPSGPPPTLEEYMALVDPQDRERVMDAVKLAVRAGEPLDHDYRVIRPDGERRWVHAFVQPIRQHGELVGLQGASQDITARRMAEDAHRTAETKFRALVESAPDAIVVSDATGAVVLLNDEASRLLGYSRENLLGRNVTTLLSEGSGATGPAEAMQQDTSAREGWALRGNGSMIAVDVRNSCVATTEGTLTFTSIRDATERRRVEDVLRTALDREREATAHLRKLDETKNAILNAVSHELRTPLTAILGFTELMQSPEIRNDDAMMDDLVGRLDGSSQRLGRLLQDLLDLSRLEHGNIEPQRKRRAIDDLVKASLFDLELQDHPLTVSRSVGTCVVDPTHFERIVQNLVANAVKYTPPGTPITVTARPEVGEGVTIAVDDEGPGVPANMRAVIFEPFTRLGDGKFTQGTGVGLALVDRFAKMHGGRAWLTENDGGGAAFRVYLPGPGVDVPESQPASQDDGGAAA